MLVSLILKNFKLFQEDTRIPLSGLNLLTGINGRGKSTVIQSLLLMKQATEISRTTNEIFFNGREIKLGSFTDVKNKNKQRSDFIELSFLYPKYEIKYRLSENQYDQLVADIKEIDVCNNDPSHRLIMKIRKEGSGYKLIKGSTTNKCTLFDLFINDYSLLNENDEYRRIKKAINFTKIHYVSADRVGPQEYYPMRNIMYFPTVGAIGDNTISILYNKRAHLVNNSIIKNISKIFHIPEDKIGRTVEFQTNFWLNEIFEGAKYKIQPLIESNLLLFNINTDDNFYKPTNVGYGYSYALPIIVSGLIAKSGEMLIVENPEAHLHPFAQSILAKFLSLVSLCGVQVIIESHSEHILNGLRIPVYDKVITKEHLNVLYFSRDYDNHFMKIEVDDAGGINNWPKDFFDQATKDLNYLFGI